MLAIQLSRNDSVRINFFIRSVLAGLAMTAASIAGYSDFSSRSTGALVFIFWPPVVFLAGALLLVGLHRWRPFQ